MVTLGEGHEMFCVSFMESPSWLCQYRIRDNIKFCYCDHEEFYIGKAKRKLHDRKIEHFKALAKSDHLLAIADDVKTTGHNIKCDHFEILASEKTDLHRKMK